MDVASLKAYIKQNNIPRILLFAGEEWEVQKVYIKQIQKVTGLEQRRIDSVTDILKNAKSKSIISKPCLYIVRDDKEFIANEKMQGKVGYAIGASDNMLIFLITKLDKRTKFYNKYKSSIIEFEALPEHILMKYIDKQLPLSTENEKKLIEVCERSYGRILLEIDKIKQYRTAYGEKEIFHNDAFNILMKNKVIYQPPKDAIFDLVEAIMQRKKSSFALLQESYASGEATMVMLSVLFNTAKAVLQIQTCKSNKIAESTGLTSFQIMKAKELANHYKVEDLKNILSKIQEVELGIKTGKVEDRFAMEYLLVSIL